MHIVFIHVNLFWTTYWATVTRKISRWLTVVSTPVTLIKLLLSVRNLSSWLHRPAGWFLPVSPVLPSLKPPTSTDHSAVYWCTTLASRMTRYLSENCNDQDVCSRWSACWVKDKLGFAIGSWVKESMDSSTGAFNSRVRASMISSGCRACRTDMADM